MALFAALSYAVTQSGRGGGTIDKEQAMIAAAQITQIGAAMKQSALRMVLTGTPASSITCEPAPNGTDCGRGSLNGGKNFCTTGATCLFAPEGGGATLPQISQSILVTSLIPAAYPNAFVGPTSYQGFIIDGFNAGGADSSVPGIGTAADDDIMRIFFLTQSICQAINTGLGISGIPTWDNTSPWVFTNTAGLESACVLDITSGHGYTYYQVLYAN